jgi:hypothetical protein
MLVRNGQNETNSSFALHLSQTQIFELVAFLTEVPRAAKIDILSQVNLRDVF